MSMISARRRLNRPASLAVGALLAAGLGTGLVAACTAAGADGSGTARADTITDTPTATTPTTSATGATGSTGSTPGNFAPGNPAPRNSAPGSGHTQVQVLLRDVAGRSVGTLRLSTLTDGATDVRVRAWALTPGFHGIHIHQNGVCDPHGAKPFTSAGDHFNPTGNPEGMQAGAFPVLLAGPDGTAQTEFRDANLRVPQLFGPTGSSVIIHALPDNYANIPVRYTSNGVPGPDNETKMTGDGGDRVACGVIAPPTTSAPAPTLNNPTGSATNNPATPGTGGSNTGGSIPRGSSPGESNTGEASTPNPPTAGNPAQAPTPAVPPSAGTTQ